MPRIAVGSTNPAKLTAVRRAFVELDGREPALITCDTATASAQPWGEAATRAGAIARARQAHAAVADAAWAVGLEGGLVAEDDGAVLVTSWIAARGPGGAAGAARTAGFYLPDAVAHAVAAGTELSAAWSLLQGREAVGRGVGTVGLVTGGARDRTQLYAEAVVLAVAQARLRQGTLAGGCGL